MKSMTEKLGMYIQPIENGRMAKMVYIHPYYAPNHLVTIDDIKAELRKKNINFGIRWPIIEKIIEIVSKNKVMKENIVVAVGEAQDYEIRFTGNDKALSIQECEEVLLGLKALSDRLLKDAPTVEENFGALFIAPGETLLEFKPKAFTDIYGVKSLTPFPSHLIKHSRRIEKKVNNGDLILFAKSFGYLIQNEDQELDILYPFKITSDSSELWFYQAPLSYGQVAFNKCLYQFFERNGVSFEIKSGDKCKKELIRKGKKPKHGKDAYINWLIDFNKLSEKEEEDTVDYKEMSPFIEVVKDQKIAEKHFATKGQQGWDVFDRAILCNSGVDLRLESNHFVLTRKEDYGLSYHSKIDGILTYDKSYLNIEPVLHINGDVNLKSGNISHKESIIVSGDVASGFKVNCGKNLLIKGSVENGAEIDCEGSLKVMGGVFGEKTNITVKGYTYLNFIKNSRICCHDNIRIRQYAHNSELVSLNNIYILGANLSESQTALVGGSLSVYKNLICESVGSYAVPTHIQLGYNALIQKDLKLVKTYIKDLTKNIIKIQNSIGLDLTKNQKDQLLDAKKKNGIKKLKEVLNEIKLKLVEKENLESKYDLLKDRYINPKSETCRCIIKKKSIPDVFIKIYEEPLLLSEAMLSKLIIKFENNKLIQEMI